MVGVPDTGSSCHRAKLGLGPDYYSVYTSSDACEAFIKCPFAVDLAEVHKDVQSVEGDAPAKGRIRTLQRRG